MDKKLKIAYILTGIAIIGQIFFYKGYVDYFIVPVSIVLLLFSILGSLRARLALLGFLLYHCFVSLNSTIFILFRANDLSNVLNLPIIKIFIVYVFILLAATILLLKSFNIKETSSRFSERAPLKLTAALFLIMIAWDFTQIFVLPILNYKEMIEAVQEGMFNMKYFLHSLFFLVLNTLIVFAIYKKKAIGFVLAPIILIMTIIIRIEVLFNNYPLFKYNEIISAFKHFFNANYIRLFDFFLHCIIFPLLAVPLVLFFIFCLKEDTLGIITTKLKRER